MHLFFVLLFLFIGIAIIIWGGNIFITAASALAKATGIPKMLIGATIVSIATVLPELMVSSLAVWQGSTDFSFGNNIGSIICNTGLIMSIALAIAPQNCGKGFKSNALFMLISLLILIFLAHDLIIGYSDAIILFLMLLAFILISIRQAKNSPDQPSTEIDMPVKKCLVHFLIGAACIAIGAQLMVKNGVAFATILGIPERIIGLTIVSIGSSFPELVTIIAAIRKKEFQIGVGNILGANILNILLLPAVCAIIAKGQLILGIQKLSFSSSPIPTTLYIDIPFAMLLTLLMIIPPLIKKKFFRWQGFICLILYLLYNIFIFITIK